MSKNKTYPAGTLADGAEFEIVRLEDQYRNLKIKRSNDCGTYIAGERLIKDGDNEKWVPLQRGYCISGGTEVRIKYREK